MADVPEIITDYSARVGGGDLQNYAFGSKMMLAVAEHQFISGRNAFGGPFRLEVPRGIYECNIGRNPQNGEHWLIFHHCVIRPEPDIDPSGHGIDCSMLYSLAGYVGWWPRDAWDTEFIHETMHKIHGFPLGFR